MTLEQWMKKHPEAYVQNYGDEGVKLVFLGRVQTGKHADKLDGRYELWMLTDYVASSVSGERVWMAPRVWAV